MDDDTILQLADNIIKEFNGRKGFDDVYVHAKTLSFDSMDLKVALELKQAIINLIKNNQEK